MKTIINFIINIFRAFILALLNVKAVIVNMPNMFLMQANIILAFSGSKATACKAKGGFKNNLVGFGISALGFALVGVCGVYTAMFFVAPFLNPLKFFGALIGGTIVMTAANYMIVERTPDNLLVI